MNEASGSEKTHFSNSPDMDSSPDHSDTSTVPTPACSTPSEIHSMLAKHNLTLEMLHQIHSDLISIARTAGSMMLAASPSTSTSTSTSKKNSSDLVTSTDQAIESLVYSQLQKSYPDIGFLGEEMYQEGQKLPESPTFVCDPIDGTLNFIHGFPNTAISLALTIERKPVVGVVFNPFRGDMYTAIKSYGAYLTTINGDAHRLPLRPIPPTLSGLSGSLVALEWGTSRSGPNFDLRTSTSRSLLSSDGAMVHSIRSSGSAALDFCYVAAGQLDLFWEGGCWAWDVAAGWCILDEAGGMVVSANPGEWEPEVDGRLYLAVRRAKRIEQEAIVREVWELMGEQRFDFG